MRGFLLAFFFALILSLQLSATVLADDGQTEIPDKVSKGHWACASLNELAAKYGALKKLPQMEVLERKDLAATLFDLLVRVQAKCEREGSEAVPREDLDRLAVLYEALKGELAQYEGYQTRREAIERMLAKPEVPSFEYKVGINGFLRGEGAGNFHLDGNSFAPGHDEGRFVYRVKPYAYWHPADWLDLHAEGEGYGFTGPHHNYDMVSLYQGFAEARLPGSDLLSLKAGRQEFVYGSAFILGANSFYQGLTFDSARLRVKPTAPLTIDLLGGAYADPFSGGIEGNLAGGYASYCFSDDNALEAYAFRDTGSSDHHAGEYLAIWGLRGTAKIGQLGFEFEPVYESGRTFNGARTKNDGINAYGGHLDATFGAVMAGYNAKFFSGFAYGSGGREAANGVSAAKEFRNPNNDSSLVGDMHVVGDYSGVNAAGPGGEQHASGLQAYTLGCGIDLAKEINISATGRYFLANRVEPGFSDNLGLETDFALTYNVSDRLTLITGYDRFFTGSFFREASGSSRDINYGYLMLQFDLAHQKAKPPTT